MLWGRRRRDVDVGELCADTATGAVRVRTYCPRGIPGRVLPVVVALHGGGWSSGELRLDDWLYSTLAARTSAVVVGVDSRLAPLQPFPAGLEDAYAVLVWLHDNAERLSIDPHRMAVMGQSAGANLAAVLCLLSRDRNGPALAGQVLIYPPVDAAAATGSYRRFATGGVLDAAMMRELFRQYVGPDGDPFDWRVSPLRAPSHRGLPSALVITAGQDPLRDDGALYAACLSQNGVPVIAVNYPRAPHAFVNAPLLPASRHAVRHIANALIGMVGFPERDRFARG